MRILLLSSLLGLSCLAAEVSVTPIKLGTQQLLISAPSGAKPDTETARKLQARLTCHFEDATVAEVADWLQKGIGRPVVVAPHVADHPITLKLAKVKAETCVKWLESLGKVSVSYVHEGLYISDRKVSGGQVTKLYAVGDLTMPVRNFPGPRLAQSKDADTSFDLFNGDHADEEESNRWDIDELADVLERHLQVP